MPCIAVGPQTIDNIDRWLVACLFCFVFFIQAQIFHNKYVRAASENINLHGFTLKFNYTISERRGVLRQLRLATLCGHPYPAPVTLSSSCDEKLNLPRNKLLFVILQIFQCVVKSVSIFFFFLSLLAYTYLPTYKVYETCVLQNHLHTATVGARVRSSHMWQMLLLNFNSLSGGR